MLAHLTREVRALRELGLGLDGRALPPLAKGQPVPARERAPSAAVRRQYDRAARLCPARVPWPPTWMACWSASSTKSVRIDAKLSNPQIDRTQRLKG